MPSRPETESDQNPVRSIPAKSITEAATSPNRKDAARSEFSSNLSSTSDNEYSGIGADCTIPELPFEGGWTQIYKCHDNALARRTNNIEYKIVIFIISRTTSAARRPEFAQISMRDYRQRTGVSERDIYFALASLKEKTFIAYDERGGVKACPENFETAPLPAARKCRRREKKAAVLAPAAIAALQLTSEETLGENQETDGYLRVSNDCGNEAPAHERTDQAVGEVGCGGQIANQAEHIDDVSHSGDEDGTGRENGDTTSLDHGFIVFDTRTLGVGTGLYLVRHTVAARLKLTAVAGEADCKKPETYCPWNWSCPHLSTSSELVSIKHSINEKPTTTKRSAPGAAETENAYLARFLQPATRIGELLQIDDDAAARMWTESAARNPELTPREFVILVRMKLKEWGRESDDRPGRKIRSLTGLLVRSMPNAVIGALYLTAREQAPAELERDAYDARAILAAPDAAPRDRAWALAILAEGAET